MTRFWFKYNLQTLSDRFPSIVKVNAIYFYIFFYKKLFTSWENNSSQLIRYLGLTLSIDRMSFWLIGDILWIEFGNCTSCFMIICLRSKIFLALKGGLYFINIFTFQKASNNSRLLMNKYLLCSYIKDFVKLKEPYLKENQALFQQALFHLKFSKIQNQRF